MGAALRVNFEQARAVVERGRQEPYHHETKLTVREFEIMTRIGHGEAINEIARAMFLAPSTISTYRTRILAKLGFKNNCQVILFVAELERELARAE